MLRNTLLSCLLLASVMLAGPSLAADEPTLHQVYQAADAGRLNEAQAMMDKVLRNHPDSAKAHFVQAELLARQGRLGGAAAELSAAERLAPGLPFAKPEAIDGLKRHIASSDTAKRLSPSAYGTPSAPASQIPWGLLLLGLGLIAAVVFFVRRTSQGNANVQPSVAGAGYGAGFGRGAPLQPYGAGGVAAPMGPTAGGMGSGILGGLATGAALGAGMVAGEALMHRFTDPSRVQGNPTSGSTPVAWDSTPDDMGGTDFGISDSSSWDDSSGGGDWS
jgi:hypothetical protein